MPRAWRESSLFSKRRRRSVAWLFAATIALSASPARADGLDALALIGIGGTVYVVALAPFDIGNGVSNEAPSTFSGVVQTLAGGSLLALSAYGAVSAAQLDVERGRDGRDSLSFVLTSLTGFAAAYAGYGIGGLADTSSARGSAVGVVTALSVVGAGRAALTIGGLPRDRATGVVEAVLAAPGIAAGTYWALDTTTSVASRVLSWSLVGFSAAVALHGVVDAITYNPPRPPPRGDCDDPLPHYNCPARASWMIAPMPVYGIRGAAPGLGVVGSF
jgi:hypothetical protein